MIFLALHSVQFRSQLCTAVCSCNGTIPLAVLVSTSRTAVKQSLALHNVLLISPFVWQIRILVCVFQIRYLMFLKARTFHAQKCIVPPLPRQPDLVRTTSHGIQAVHKVTFSSRGDGYRCSHIENTFSPRGFFFGRCPLATENDHLRLSLASTIVSVSLGGRSRLASCDASLTPPRGCPATLERSCGP